MDRNIFPPVDTSSIRVALRKESVDRNGLRLTACLMMYGSLSARRAWIEMRMALFPAPPTMVALRKESVDRNSIAPGTSVFRGVALRKESVDRNLVLWGWFDVCGCRSPQGERG